LGAVFWKNWITKQSLFFIWFTDRDQLFLPSSGSPGAIKPLILYLWIIMKDLHIFFRLYWFRYFMLNTRQRLVVIHVSCTSKHLLHMFTVILVNEH
jgi:hypothetical protein